MVYGSRQIAVNFTGRKFKIAIVIGSLVLAFLLVIFSPTFRIEEVVIHGNFQVSRADIMERLALTNTSNIFMFNTNAAHDRIMGNLYIGDVTFRRDFPNRLYVTVLERRFSAYVEHTPGNILLLDDVGRVLSVRSVMSESLPILEGLQFNRWQLGEILNVENATDFDNIVLYTQLLIAHGLIHQVTNINVSDPFNIRILVNYMEFHVGGVSDADEKVRTIAAMLEHSPDAGMLRGYVDMRVRRSEYFFRILQ